MRTILSWIRAITLIIFVAVAACSPAQVTLTPESQASPNNAETPFVTATASPTATPSPPVEPAEKIFYNGMLITMEESQPLAEAIALRQGLVQAVGTNQEILALRGAKTQVVDLQGRTMLPGFVDGHTHILAFPDRMGKSLDEAQETAIRYGFTTVNEMWADQGFLGMLIQAEQEGRLRLRVNLFPSYNDGILDNNRKKVLLKTWYPGHGPILDPDRRLRIPGIKIYMDGDNWTRIRGCWAFSEPLPPGAPALRDGVCGTNRGDLYWSQEELNQVVSDAQQAGYRVAFHAMGDGAIETALNAIEFALDGQPNERYRHQIEHNSLARPDQLPRYRDLDIVVSVRGYGDFCDLQSFEPDFGPDRYPWYANRYALPGLGIHAYIETDFGWTVDPNARFSQRSLDPIMQLYGMVTHQFVGENGAICAPDPLVAAHSISVERALQMLTLEPAYAVSMEDHIGSLKAGKHADLVVLSGNPLSVDANALKDLQVWMTMIAGKAEYCAPGQEFLCAKSVVAVTLPSTGNLALNQTVTTSKHLSTNPPEMAADGDETTHWGAGDFAPQWLEVNLGAPATITEIRLMTSQLPDGNTRHRILVRGIQGNAWEVHLFDQFTRDAEWLIFKPDQPLENVQFIRIETLDSPSWVSWVEVQVFGTR